MNNIKLVGTIGSDINFSHEINEKRFCEFFIDVERKSGAVDTLKVIAPEDVSLIYEKGERVTVIGEVRTKDRDGHVDTFVFAKGVFEAEIYDFNGVELHGFVCSKNELRNTPLTNQYILELIIASNRGCGKSDYIHCILWNSTAIRYQEIEIGSEVFIRGRLQSRAYTKNVSEELIEIRKAYELSVYDFELAKGEEE